VARYLQSFDATVVATDPNLDAAPPETHVTLLPLSDLLQGSDVVSVHTALTEQTYGLFGQRQFAAMKRGSWFINTSRGELVDETALARALEAGPLAGAALDVLCGEPAPGPQNPLITYMRNHDNLLITPHLGGCTRESMEKTEIYLAQKLVQVWSTLQTNSRGSAVSHASIGR
jgi:D-3-phosphoglycerate dehydrogenase